MLHSVTVQLRSSDFLTADVTYRSDPSPFESLASSKKLYPTFRTVSRQLGPTYPRFIPARVEW